MTIILSYLIFNSISYLLCLAVGGGGGQLGQLRCRSRCAVPAVPSCAVVVVHRRVQQHAHQLMCVHSRNVTENESVSTDRRGKTLTCGLRRRRCRCPY